ncbi:GNAT family N-acetyltransferase, partial [Nostoc sp. CHAB 5715]|nr:GNAT family N-acetyltransferase [Nostoc sp. CHAB 5715]
AEPAWRELLGQAYATPYQSPAFLAAWLANVAGHEAVAPLIVVARDAGGAVVAVLPLGVRRRLSLTVASFLGGAHVNYNLPVIRTDRLSRFTPAETQRLLHEAARAGGIDGFALTNQPFAWNGRPNPFAALPSQPSLDPAFSGPLAATIDEHLALHVSSKTRSAQRRKLRRFEEHGAVRLYRAATAEESGRVLDAYFRQKAERLAARGIDNVFERPGVRDFIRQAAGLDGGRQSIDLYGFDLGPHVIATFGVIADRDRMCGMFNSITSCELARYSPGELLLNFMVEDAIGRGMRCFDLGVGAAPYKALHCPNVEPLFDSVFGVTPLGRAGAAALGGARAAKARIKANPNAYALLTGLRKFRARKAAPTAGADKAD